MGFTDLLNGVFGTLVYTLAGIALIVIGKLAYQVFNPGVNVKDELVEKDNLAFAVAHMGYFVGLLISIGSVLTGPSDGLLIDIINIGIYGLLSILLLNLAIIINDKLILRKFDIKKEIITDRNVGSGAAEAGAAIATGLVICGSLYGEGTIWTALVFWVVGQAVLIATSFLYNAMLPYDIHDHIEKDNVAVGVGFAGALIALGNLIRNGLVSDFTDWSESAIYLGFDVVVGLLMLPIARWGTDKILLPGRRLTDEIVNQDKPNVGAAILEAFSYIGGSVLICWALA
ncbi:DUF350 domain-containing protein [Fulvitalea axinellae]|uniref:DUF350 domain-containing protein n=1 Tax=Fulvitalea axinellae TaxID=1182444 RepID=A0AAU9CEX9_9BACT|nr:DUF350 domain-containing protein [Fulvitalea axinellae]